MWARIASSRLAIVALVVVVVLLFAGVGSTLSIAGQVQAPAEESYKGGHGDRYTGTVRLGGAFGSDERFTSSWYSDGRSEPFTVTGSLTVTERMLVHEYEYRVFTKSSASAPWVEANRHKVSLEKRFADNDRDRTMQTAAWPTHIVGPIVGAVMVELWVNGEVNCPWNHRVPGVGCTSDWFRLAQDGATLVSGVAGVTFAVGSDRYEEGETARVNVRTDGGVWRLTLVDDAGRNVCGPKWQAGAQPLRFFEWGQSTEDGTAGGGGHTTTPSPTECSLVWTGARAGTVEYTVPRGAFNPSGTNVWKFLLDNEIVNQGSLQTFIVDQHEKAPEVPTTKTTSSDGKLVSSSDPGARGSSVPRVAAAGRLTYSFESRANPAAGAAGVSHFLVYIWHGDSQLMPADGSKDWIANGERVDAQNAGDGKYTGSYSYTPLRQANIQAWAVAVDAQARPSGTAISEPQAKQQAQGTAADGEAPNGIENPNTNSRTEVLVEGASPSGAVDTPRTATADPVSFTVLLLVLVAGVAAFLAWRFLPAPVQVRMGVVAVLAAVTFVIVWTSLGVS